MLIIGKNPLREAMAGDTKIVKIYLQEGLHGNSWVYGYANDKNIMVQIVSRAALDKMAGGLNHRGFLAEAQEYEYGNLDEMLLSAKERDKPLLLVILDGIVDPHNLGSIIRVAECAGADGVVIPARRACGVNETVVRISEGATAHVKIAMVNNINDTIRKLKDNWVNVYYADANGEDMYAADYSGDTAIVIGSEGGGVKQLTRKLCDKGISIPQYGKINSLNASVAAGILLYTAIRGRK